MWAANAFSFGCHCPYKVTSPADTGIGTLCTSLVLSLVYSSKDLFSRSCILSIIRFNRSHFVDPDEFGLSGKLSISWQ
jgi:hypothetical protein